MTALMKYRWIYKDGKVEDSGISEKTLESVMKELGWAGPSHRVMFLELINRWNDKDSNYKYVLLS